MTNTSSENAVWQLSVPVREDDFNEFPCENPKVDIVALCDIYQPSIDEALNFAPKAKYTVTIRRCWKIRI